MLCGGNSQPSQRALAGTKSRGPTKQVRATSNDLSVLGMDLARLISALPAGRKVAPCARLWTLHIKSIQTTGWVGVGVVELFEYFADITREADSYGNTATEICGVPIELCERQNILADRLH